jgi:hypothetical protein
MFRYVAATISLMLWPLGALAQSAASAAGANGPSVSFPSLTAIPVPYQSISGRWSSLNPPNRSPCSYNKVIGRVVSTRLILAENLGCQNIVPGDRLVNVELSNPADAMQMVTGRLVAITARFVIAREHRVPEAEYYIAEKAEVVAGSPRTAPTSAFMSYMLCQAPELDMLAKELGSELCVQSTLLENLSVTNPGLETAARMPAKLSPNDTAPGGPDAITCRLDPGLSSLHLQAIACARNSYWAWYRVTWNSPLSSIGRSAAPP